jgi:hypothetical protein
MRFFVHYFEKAWSGLCMNANSRSDDSLCQSCISQLHSWFHSKSFPSSPLSPSPGHERGEQLRLFHE